jgi:hypothetical protein
MEITRIHTIEKNQVVLGLSDKEALLVHEFVTELFNRTDTSPIYMNLFKEKFDTDELVKLANIFRDLRREVVRNL